MGQSWKESYRSRFPANRSPLLMLSPPMSDIYDRLGIDEAGAIGILTISPYEASIIAADVATKAADVEIGFLDRFTGSVVVSGDVQSVETALKAVCTTLKTRWALRSWILRAHEKKARDGRDLPVAGRRPWSGRWRTTPVRPGAPRT